MLLLLLGGRKEPINKLKVQEVLEKIDPDYKKYANSVLSKAADELKSVFGYTLFSGNDIVGVKDGKKDEYFLISNTTSDKLRNLLARGDKSASQFGFMLLVLFSVLMAPRHKIACKDILTAVRMAEPRFPVDILVPKGGSAQVALAVPELGDDFLCLINRMKKVRYSTVLVSQSACQSSAHTYYSTCLRFCWCYRSTTWAARRTRWTRRTSPRRSTPSVPASTLRCALYCCTVLSAAIYPTVSLVRYLGCLLVAERVVSVLLPFPYCDCVLLSSCLTVCLDHSAV